MDPDDFLEAVDKADFESLMGDRLQEFQGFMAEAVADRRPRIIIRFAGEYEESGSVLPFYSWVVYTVAYGEHGVGFKNLELYFPEQGIFEAYLNKPEDIPNEPYFEAIIEGN